MNILVFDIETIPDVDSGRKLYGLEQLNDADTAQSMALLRREKVGHDFLPHYLQRVVAISAVAKRHDKFKVSSFGNNQSSEAEIIQAFFDYLERTSPTLVSWNGSGFDLPVLHYRGLLHRVTAPRYWDNGHDDNNFKWNNYLSRYHERHTDLMDVLAAYNGRANAPLDEIASMLGYPGKMGMSGAKVWDAYQQGEIDAIRNYCETDVLNTYLVYLRYQMMRGLLNDESLQTEENIVREFLAQANQPHLTEFLQHWHE